MAGLRFYVRRGIKLKEAYPDLVEGTGHTIEQGRPDVLKQRHDPFDDQLDLKPERLVFIDERGRPPT